MKALITLLLPLLAVLAPAATSASASVGRPARRHLQIESGHKPCLCPTYIRILPVTLSCPPCDFSTPKDAIRSVRESAERRRIERKNFLSGKKVHWSGLQRSLNERSFVPHPPFGRVENLTCTCTDTTTGDLSLVEGVIGASGGACPTGDTTKCVIHEAVLSVGDNMPSPMLPSNTSGEALLMISLGDAEEDVPDDVVLKEEDEPADLEQQVQQQQQAQVQQQEQQHQVQEQQQEQQVQVQQQQQQLVTKAVCPCNDNATLYTNEGVDCPLEIPAGACPGDVAVPEPVKVDNSTGEAFCECVEPNGILQYPKDPQESSCACPVIEHKDEVITIVGVLPVERHVRDCDCPPGNLQNVQSVPIERDCPEGCKLLPRALPSLVPVSHPLPVSQCICHITEQGGNFTFEEKQSNGTCRNGCLPSVPTSSGGAQEGPIDVIALRACVCGKGTTAAVTPLSPYHGEACPEGCVEAVEEIFVGPSFVSTSANNTDDPIQSEASREGVMVSAGSSDAVTLMMDCPVTMPVPGSGCAGIEGKTCSYGNECCRYREADGTLFDCACGPSYQCTCFNDGTFACLNTDRCLIGEDVGCSPTVPTTTTTTAQPETTVTIKIETTTGSSPNFVLPDCPAVEPAPGSPCAGIEGKTCFYGNECCRYRDIDTGLSDCSCGPSFQCTCSADGSFACQYTNRCLLSFDLGCTPPTTGTTATPAITSSNAALTACPDQRPEAGSSCGGLEGQQCSYGNDCCKYLRSDGLSECLCYPSYKCNCLNDGTFMCHYPTACKFGAELGCIPPLPTTAKPVTEVTTSGPAANNEQDPLKKGGEDVKVAYGDPTGNCSHCRKFAASNSASCPDRGWDVVFDLGASRCIVEVVSCPGKLEIRMVGSDITTFTASERDFFRKTADGIGSGSPYASIFGSLDRLVVLAGHALQDWPNSEFPVDFFWPRDVDTSPGWFDANEMLLPEERCDSPSANSTSLEADGTLQQRKLRGGRLEGIDGKKSIEFRYRK